MATPIYKLFFFKRTALALSEPEALENLAVRMDEFSKRLGVKTLLTAEMRWSNEHYEFFGVELFPSLEAEQEHTRCITALDWYTYVEGESFLGIPMDETVSNLVQAEPPAPGEQPIYRVYLSRLTAAGHALNEDTLLAAQRRAGEAFANAGGRRLLSAYTRWNNEDWDYFGIERFPGSEAVLRYSQYLTVAGWYIYYQARSFLGTGSGGILTGIGD